MARLLNPVIQYLDGAGDPVINGKLYFYNSGTTTPRNTWADSGQSTPNSNPVLLDGAGRTPNVWLSGNYRVVLTTNDGQQVWERDPVEGELSTGEFASWDILITYSINSIVRGSDDNYYISIIPSNIGNDPVTASLAWSQIAFITQWNPNQTYKIGQNVFESGTQYRALTVNTNKQPSLNPSDWGVPTGGVVPGNPVSVLTNDVPYLAAGNNLSDVDNAATARASLGLGTAATANILDLYPVGSIYLSLTSTNPGTFLGGTWALISSDSSIRLGDGSNLPGTPEGSTNTPLVPVVEHSHFVSLTTNVAGEHTHIFGANVPLALAGADLDISGTPQNASISQTLPSGDHFHTISGNTQNAGVAGATIDTRGIYLRVNVWNRVS